MHSVHNARLYTVQRTCIIIPDVSPILYCVIFLNLCYNNITVEIVRQVALFLENSATCCEESKLDLESKI